MHVSKTMWIQSLLNVMVFGENSSLQQHRRGESLSGQRQRQVSLRHDHLPIPDHLPPVEQHGGRCQVGGFNRKALISRAVFRIQEPLV